MNSKSPLPLILILMTACNPVTETTETKPKTTTYHQDIKPLLESKCLSCHRQGDVGLYPLENYEQAKAMGPALVGAVQNRTMPPWGHDQVVAPSKILYGYRGDHCCLFQMAKRRL